MSRLLRVFLCHASQDKPTVWKLHRYLKQHGIKPWLDQEDLLPGEDWEVEIPKALFASDVILVCLSKNSVNKEGMVQKEITFALDKALEKPEGTIFIIPVKLEECEIPTRLTRYQWVDLSRADGRKRLLLGLNKRVNDLGDEVQQITLDDTRQRTPAPKTRKPEPKKPEEQISPVPVPVKEEVIEEPKNEIPVLLVEHIPANVEKEPEGERIQPKPFTKFLDPSSLAPNVTSSPQAGRQENVPSGEAELKSVRKSAPNKNLRWLGIGGIAIIAFLFILLGGNYIAKNFPSATETPTVRPSATLKPPTSTATKIPTITPVPPTPTPTLGIGSTEVSTKDGMVLVYVPKGTFTMGSDSYSDEQPIHQVNLEAFWIDQTEVTNAMYAKCVDDGKCDPPNGTSSYSHPDYYGNSEFDNYPVIYVSWNDALSYCAWVDRRLPTEAEWEKAARGTDERAYPWGEGIDCDKANHNSSCVGDTSPVKKYSNGVSPYGAYDMAGNVWEWVSSLYQPYPYDSSDGRENMSSAGSRVLRGGSWILVGYVVRSASRIRHDPTDSDYIFGFRCSRSP